MSSDSPAIQVKDVSKCFEIYDRPEERLRQFVMPRLRSMLGLKPRDYHRTFWALRGVSFEVGRGQTVGIIGRNGSGKSTLLQIVTGTMSPTSGEVVTNGRVAALLELGSGFNPDFTGRENVYTNAHLLGLTRTQTDEAFDYIAGFADIGDHLDQPVRTYSSGMMLRLAFAVQIAVDAEILIIDEALAVGDARFQMKCFRRLDEIKARGTTILFVSHATELVRSFCDLGLVLEGGQPVFWGDSKAATIKYLELLFPEESGSPKRVEADMRRGSAADAGLPTAGTTDEDGVHITPTAKEGQAYGVGGASVESIWIRGLQRPNLLIGGAQLHVLARVTWDPKFIGGLLERERYVQNITVGISLTDNKGGYIFGCNGFDKGIPMDPLAGSAGTVEFLVSLPHLAEGDYFLTVAVALGEQKRHIQLQWLDCIMQLKCLKAERSVFGILAVDYEMRRLV